MEYTILGDSGIRVSQYCLGTMTFGHGTDLPDAQTIVSMAFERGVRFFDTANAYSIGASETMLGKALGKKRNEVVLATKFSNPMGGKVNDSGWSPVHIADAVHQSLKRLGTDYIDIYYVHHTDNTASMERVLRSLDDLRSQGKIRSYACSNFESWRLSDMYWLSRMNGFDKPVCYQGAYSLVMRDMESELLPYCNNRSMGVVAFWALAAGFLAGKYRPGQKEAEGSRSAQQWAFPYEHFAPNADQTLSCLLEHARRLSLPPAALAMEWVRSNPAVSSVLFGARTPQQLEQNLLPSDASVPPEILQDLSLVSQQPLRYPYWMEKEQDQIREDAVEKQLND